MRQKSYHIKSPQACHTIVPKLLEQAGKLRIWHFRGELSSGKTTLIKALCQHLGVKQTVTSPTFGLVHQYTTSNQQPINHIDLYRLNHIESVFAIGLEEMLASSNYVFIEWPQIIQQRLQHDYFDIEIILKHHSHRIIHATNRLTATSTSKNTHHAPRKL